MDKTIFIIWLCIIALSIYNLVKLHKLNKTLQNDLEELEESADLYNLDYAEFEKITFILIPDEHGTIYDKEGNRFRLERNNEHRK